MSSELGEEKEEVEGLKKACSREAGSMDLEERYFLKSRKEDGRKAVSGETWGSYCVKLKLERWQRYLGSLSDI